MDTGASQPTATDYQIRELWREFAHNRNPVIREQLIEHHLPLAKKIATVYFARRPLPNLEYSDFLQLATLGLIEAVDRFDPSNSASFETYASYRIKGAILNGAEKLCEKMEWRAFRRRLREQRAQSVNEGQVKKTRVKGDLFAEMAEMAIEIAIGYLLEDNGIFTAGDVDHSHDPYRSYELKRLQERMTLIVEALPDMERRIIKLHYFQHMDFGDIARTMDLTKGRISQLHARALTLLHEGYRSLGHFDVSY